MRGRLGVRPDGRCGGSGFDVLRFYVERRSGELDERLIDLHFESVGEALVYFAGPIGLGAAGDLGEVELVVGLDLTASELGDGFSTRFALALVPEPASASLLALGLAALAFRGRRRRARELPERSRLLRSLRPG